MEHRPSASDKLWFGRRFNSACNTSRTVILSFLQETSTHPCNNVPHMSDPKYPRAAQTDKQVLQQMVQELQLIAMPCLGPWTPTFLHGDHACIQQTSQWLEFRHDATQAIQTCQHHHTHPLEQHLRALCLVHFPKTNRPRTSLGTVPSIATRMWQARRLAKQYRGSTLLAVFRCWLVDQVATDGSEYAAFVIPG